MDIFAERLKELRSDADLSQEKLAEKLGYTQGNVSGWENGTVEPKLTALQQIALFFHVSSDYLLGISSDIGMTDSTLDNNEKLLLINYRALPTKLKKLLLETSKHLKR